MANEQLTKTKAILVEGLDEQNFFTALFKHLHRDDVDIILVGGKENFKNEFPAFLKRPDFYHITSYAIVVDADSSAANTFQSISNLLKKHGQPVPKKLNEHTSEGNQQTGVYIMPGDLDNGMLEDFCLKTVADHPAMPCLDNYFSGLKKVLTEKPENEPKDPRKFYFPKNLSKAKALGFLAALHEPFSSVGVAALNGYWNFEHSSLEELKSFLQKL
jgi:hypothetical protein